MGAGGRLRSGPGGIGHVFSRMSADDVVVLRTYGDELTAQIAAMSLEANGIPAQVSADTAGGALPGFAILFPVRLLVRADDAAMARMILDTEAPPPPDDGKP